MLTKDEFQKMSFTDIAKQHGMDEKEFILEVFPAEKNIWQTTMFYTTYEEWYKRTQNKLAKALK